MLDFFESKIIWSFLNFLIEAILWGTLLCLLPQFSVMALMGRLFTLIRDTSCKNFENIFNSK